MKNKHFLKFAFVFSAVICFSFSANAWKLGEWPRPNKSDIPEFTTQAELGEKCDCVLQGGYWEKIEGGTGACCDEPVWYCSLYAAPKCTPQPFCCQTDEECCRVQNGSWLNQEQCCCNAGDAYICGRDCSGGCCPNAGLCVQKTECVNGQLVTSETSVCDLNGPRTIYANNVSFDVNGVPYCPDCNNDEYANAHQEECCEDSGYIIEHQEACCALSSYADKHQQTCCDLSGYADENQKECCDLSGYADENQEKCCTLSSYADKYPEKCPEDETGCEALRDMFPNVEWIE